MKIRVTKGRRQVLGLGVTVRVKIGVRLRVKVRMCRVKAFGVDLWRQAIILPAVAGQSTSGLGVGLRVRTIFERRVKG